IAIASGAAAFSHVNDSGFWMANRYFGMSVADTLKSWTVMKTIVGVTGCGVALTLSAFVGSYPEPPKGPMVAFNARIGPLGAPSRGGNAWWGWCVEVRVGPSGRISPLTSGSGSPSP